MDWGNAECRNSSDGSFAMHTTYIGGNCAYGRVKVFAGRYRGNSAGANLALNIPDNYYSAASLSSTYHLSSTTSINAGYGVARNSADQRSGARQASMIATYNPTKRTTLYVGKSGIAKNFIGAMADTVSAGIKRAATARWLFCSSWRSQDPEPVGLSLPDCRCIRGPVSGSHARANSMEQTCRYMRALLHSGSGLGVPARLRGRWSGSFRRSLDGIDAGCVRQPRAGHPVHFRHCLRG
jgi:hypothetical protein